MFKTSGRASFLIILFQFLQYYVFVVLSVMLLPFFTGTFIATPSPEKKTAYKTFFVLKECLAIIGHLLFFSGPDLIANLSDGLKIIDPGFITCDDTGKLLFVIFWKHLKQLFGHFNPLPLLLISQQMWHPSSRNLSDFQMLLQNKVNR